MVTPNQTQVTEQEKKDDTRFEELKTKQDKTEQENTELGELKTKYAGRAEKRIGQLTGEKKAATARAEEAEKRAEEAEQKAKDAEEKVTSQDTTVVGNENETTEIAGKKYFTDAALTAQIRANTITEQAAIDYQAKRNEEKIVVRVKGDFKKEQEADALKKSQAEDAEAVLATHPEFGLKHPNYDSNNPLYKEWRELVADGYGLTTGGLMKALKKANKNLGTKNTHIDRSSELGLEDTAAPGEKGGKEKEKEVPFNVDEEQTAIDMYTRGDVLNPKTGRAYTNAEAIAKAKEAKKVRMR